MDSSEISEEFDDWEEIHLPSYNQISSNLPPTQHIDLDIRVSEPGDMPLLQPEEDGELSENAEPQQQTRSDSPLPSRDPETELPHQQQTESYSPLPSRDPETELPRQQQTESNSPLPPQDPETELPHQRQTRSDSKVLAMVDEVKTVICAIWRRMIAVLCSGFKCPTFVPVAALAVVILACMKVVQGRNRLLLLLREKDQRIKQLMHQVAYMKHILTTRRRVPILRIT